MHPTKITPTTNDTQQTTNYTSIPRPQNRVKLSWNPPALTHLTQGNTSGKNTTSVGEFTKTTPPMDAGPS